MKKSYRLLSILLALNIINIEDYYCVNFYRNELKLQGHLDGDEVRKWSILLAKKGGLQWNNDSKWFNSTIRIAGVEVEITLT